MSIRYFCRSCGVHRPTNEFYSSCKSKCKDCIKRQVATHRAANIERIREYDRRRGNRQPPTYGLEYRTRFPKKRSAQAALNNAVRDGRVIPWPVCAVPDCDETPEAHHIDYDKPFDVVWLCPAHHKQTHAMALTIARAATLAAK